MRFACLGAAARTAIAVLFTASVSLWTFLGASVGHVRPEVYSLTGWSAVTVTLGLVAFVIGIVMRDSIRTALLRAVVDATRPDGGEAPLRLVKTEDAG